MAILPGNRIRDDGVFGTITDNPLTAGATTFNSARLADLPVVSGNHAIITLDPLRQFGNPEIVMVTSHTASATVATIQRGMFGTIARSHPNTTLWVHAARQDDFVEVVTSSTRPTDQYRGQHIYESDTDRYVGWSSANIWQQMGLFFDPPYTELRRTAALSHTNTGGWQTIAMDTEDVDTDSMFTLANPTRITINKTGIYNVGGFFEFAGNVTGRRFIGLAFNGLGGGPTRGYIGSQTDSLTGQGVALGIARTIKLAATNFVELVGFQNSGGNLAYTAGTIHFYACYLGRGN